MAACGIQYVCVCVCVSLWIGSVDLKHCLKSHCSLSGRQNTWISSRFKRNFGKSCNFIWWKCYPLVLIWLSSPLTRASSALNSPRMYVDFLKVRCNTGQVVCPRRCLLKLYKETKVIVFKFCPDVQSSAWSPHCWKVLGTSVRLCRCGKSIRLVLCPVLVYSHLQNLLW